MAHVSETDRSIRAWMLIANTRLLYIFLHFLYNLYDFLVSTYHLFSIIIQISNYVNSTTKCSNSIYLVGSLIENWMGYHRLTGFRKIMYFAYTTVCALCIVQEKNTIQNTDRFVSKEAIIFLGKGMNTYKIRSSYTLYSYYNWYLTSKITNIVITVIMLQLNFEWHTHFTRW